jgi:MFS family permease
VAKLLSDPAARPTKQSKAQAAVQTDTAEKPSAAYAWYALGVMFLVYMMSFIDRQLVSILAEDIKADLHLSDAEIGFLYGTAFAIFYTLFGIPLGRLADGWYRTRIIAIGLGLWSAMTAVCGLASSFAQLAVSRVGVGIGEASSSPAAFSLLSDFFPKTRRGLVMAIYSSGLYLGMGLSLPIGGWVAQTWNHVYARGQAPLGLAGWQAAFFVVGMPGLLLAVVVALIREPARGATEGDPKPLVSPTAWQSFGRDLASILPPLTLWAVSKYPGALKTNLQGAAVILVVAALLVTVTGDVAQWLAYATGIYAVFSWTQVLNRSDKATYQLIWGTKAVRLAIIGFGGLAFIVYAYSFWAAPFAIRTFHVSKETAGGYIGFPGAVASGLGVVFGGRLSDWWKSRDMRGRIFVALLSAVLPVPFVVVMFNSSTFHLYAEMSPLVYFLCTMWVGPAVAAYQDFVLPQMRGIAGATYLLGSTMIGLALGPYITGKVSVLTSSLATGVLSMLVVTPVIIASLILVCRLAQSTEESKELRARAAVEKS